jgi:hypothetical protein
MSTGKLLRLVGNMKRAMTEKVEGRIGEDWGRLSMVTHWGIDQ